MTAVKPINHVFTTTSNPPTSTTSTHLYSARTPGEGYPFPRTQRSRTIYSPSVANVTHPALPFIEPVIDRIPPSPSPPAIDMEVFGQLLAMEDDDQKGQTNSRFSFTKGLVDVYFEDAHCTIEQMEYALAVSDYTKLSRLAHYLRGSAASLGVCQVAATCEALELEILHRSSQDCNSLREKVQVIKRGQIGARDWFDTFYNQ
ncbi:signal transduction histidine kinase [Melampsora americana]|nr:signal transduction histidine kinase [Melampsora americana]